MSFKTCWTIKTITICHRPHWMREIWREIQCRNQERSQERWQTLWEQETFPNSSVLSTAPASLCLSLLPPRTEGQ